jgi:ABC-type polysaccharide/polyol phosphate export permease
MADLHGTVEACLTFQSKSKGREMSETFYAVAMAFFGIWILVDAFLSALFHLFPMIQFYYFTVAFVGFVLGGVIYES